jgi:hypothetical protein
MYNEICSLFKLKLNYFRQFWSYIELSIIICSWTSVGIYIWRYQEYQQISSLFKQTNGYVYINLQLVAYVNDVLTYLLACVCFFGTIKLLHLCRFNQRLSLFSQTLQYAGKGLISFAMMFSIIFFAFLCLFYLLFNSKISTCSTLLQTAEMLSQMTLLKFNVSDLTNSAAFLGPFCFSLFIILVVFICLSMFLSIINESFRRARTNLKNENKGIFSFMFDRFQRSIGWKKATDEEIYEEYDTLMRGEYFDPIERFPDKIDQLFEAINRVSEVYFI